MRAQLQGAAEGSRQLTLTRPRSELTSLGVYPHSSACHGFRVTPRGGPLTCPPRGWDLAVDGEASLGQRSRQTLPWPGSCRLLGTQPGPWDQGHCFPASGSPLPVLYPQKLPGITGQKNVGHMENSQPSDARANQKRRARRGPQRDTARKQKATGEGSGGGRASQLCKELRA